MRSTQTYSAVFLAAALCAGAVTTASAQTRSWNWYGELVSADQAARTVTITAQTEPQVGTYLKQYKPGDKVVLIWSIDGAKGGDAQTIIAVATPDEMKMVDVGYITHVEFVSGDAAARTLTFKAVVPDAVLKTVAPVQPGKWIKVTAPMEQPGGTLTLTSAMPTDKPAPRPPKAKPEPPPAQAAGGGRGGAAAPPAAGAVKAAGGISGAWTLKLSIAGNAIESACVLAQDGTKLGGTCAAMGGDPGAVVGTVDGTKVNFTFSASLAGNSLDIVHTGTLDAAGTTMTGSATVFGMEAEFTGAKK